MIFFYLCELFVSFGRFWFSLIARFFTPLVTLNIFNSRTELSSLFLRETVSLSGLINSSINIRGLN